MSDYNRFMSLSAAEGMSPLNRFIGAGILVSVLVVYGQVAGFDFLSYDDEPMVSANAHVQEGLTPASIRYAFSTDEIGNWIPVTVLSHIVDCEFFGMRSGRHHLTNVVFHALATLLLFLVLVRSTGATLPSALVAVVFALHPLHVESVAWIAERKDVLGALFFFLGLYCYLLYAERPGTGRYLAVVGAFALGLMSKPMLVTFPFVLLLFDYWPLRRAQWPKILTEKLPLFGLSGAACVVTWLMQTKIGAVHSYPLALRVSNALVSYVVYIRQMFWPVNLAVIYPFPNSVPAWQPAVALAVILGLSFLAIRLRQRHPYLVVGWLWYLGTLVPVIGLVQAGKQAHADRYTYIPMVGLTVALAWGVAELRKSWPPVAGRAAIGGVAGVCLVLSWRQIAYWKDSETLFQHNIEVTPDNWQAEFYLAEGLMNKPGRRAEAVDHFEAVLRINPEYAEAHNNLGLCLTDAGIYGAARSHFETALRLKPSLQGAIDNIGVCLLRAGNYAESIPYFTSALQATPDSAEVRVALGVALSKIPGREQEAMGRLKEAIRLKPGYADAYFALGLMLANSGRTEEAIRQLEAGLKIRADPGAAQKLEQLRAKGSR